MNGKEKIEYVVRNYGDRMHAEAMCVIHEYYLAEDACQNAYIRLLEIADSIFDIKDERARNLCIVAVRHAAYDILRKWNRQPPMDFHYDDETRLEYIDEYPSDTEDLMQDIMILPEYYRTVITMRCFIKNSCTETAKLTSSSVGTVNSRLFRAKKILEKKWHIAS